MERYLQIGKVNIRFNLFPHLLIALAFLCLSPFLMGVENLDAGSTAKVLEMYVALLGIILLTPIFLPEQDKDIRDLVGAKYTSAAAVTIIRILEAFVFLVIFIGAYVFMLKQNHCTFPEMKFCFGTLAEAVFLGGMGLCAYRIFDQIAVAYMLPMVYYMINFGGGKKYLGRFYLFTMVYGSYQEKIYLAAAGVLFIIIGIYYPYAAKHIITKLIRYQKI